MNPDTGVAETPVHELATRWRRDLDYKIDRYERSMDREREIEEEIAAMTPEQKDAALKAVYLVERQGKQATRGVLDAQPSHDSRSLMGRLVSGLPISRAEARRYQW